MDARIVRKNEGDTYEHLWKFKAGSITGQRFDFMVGEIPYLSGPPLHTHDVQDDTFFVLDGVLTVQVNDEIYYLHSGDFASVPPGVPHTFDNTDAKQARVRVANVMTPAGTDSAFRDIHAGGPDGKAEQLDDLLSRHGVKFVGPTLGAKLGLV